MTDGRTILVSENRLFRDGIRQMLEKSRISVIGEGASIGDLADVADADGAPELIIFHLASDRRSESPLTEIHDLHEQFADAKLVILADQCTRPILPALLQADVSAILFTRISSELLERSLELVLSGHRLFPADIMPLATGDAGAGSAAPAPSDADAAVPDPLIDLPADAGRAPSLSRREHQVVQCLANGLSNKTIARRLHITEGTVKVHVKGLLRKLRASNRTQLAIWALRQAQGLGGDDGTGLQPEHRRAG